MRNFFDLKNHAGEMSVSYLKKSRMRSFFDLKNHAGEMSVCDLKKITHEKFL